MIASIAAIVAVVATSFVAYGGLILAGEILALKWRVGKLEERHE